MTKIVWPGRHSLVSITLTVMASTVLLMAAAVLAMSSSSLNDGQRRHVFATRIASPSGWHIESRAGLNVPVTFSLALKQQNVEFLESKFWSVSNPKSSEYRQYLSIAEIDEIIAPRPSDVLTVMNWLLENGVSAGQISTFSDALEVSTSVFVAERLFHTEFYEFHHDKWGRSVIRQYGSFSIPGHLRPIIELVMGISNFPKYYSKRRNPRRITSPAAGAAPLEAQSAAAYETDFGIVAQSTYGMYNIPNQTQQNASSITSQGVIEWDEESFSPIELQIYAKLVGIPITPLAPAHIIGNNSGTGSDEGSLDIQIISTVNVEAMTWYWLQDDNTWLYGFATHFYNTTDVPQVISISYGWWEGDQCAAAEGECEILKVKDDQYVARINIEFQKIGLRGISIIIASGDSGAHTRSDPVCLAKTLRADFPAASPYVTSVGATQISDGTLLSPQPLACTIPQYPCAASGTEVAVSWDVAGFASGGGFSEVAAQPEYQTSAVNAYLSSGVKLPPAHMYNASNRGHPDVAAVGHNYVMYSGGVVWVAGGTSASAPIFAAVVSLLNQASITKSKKPLGFLNPLLYQIAAENPAAFNDITVGDNICTENGCAILCKGWHATKGWDPVSGWGTPNYAVLLQEVQKLA